MSEGQLSNGIRALRKRLAIGFIVSLILTIVLGATFFLFVFQGFVDFPCFATVENGILDLGGYEDYDKHSHAILFITTYYAHMSGGGCKIVELDNGGSEDLGDYHIQVNGDMLTINGEKQLNVEESFEDENKRLGLNPWFWYSDSFKITNHGYVNSYQTSDGEIQLLDKKILIVTGNKGSRFHINPITAITFFLALIITIIFGPIILILWILEKIQRRTNENESNI